MSDLVLFKGFDYMFVGILLNLKTIRKYTDSESVLTVALKSMSYCAAQRAVIVVSAAI